MVRSQGRSLDELMRRAARRIAEARLSKGLTQEALAHRMGMAPTNYQRLEGGRQNLKLSTLAKVAAALDIDGGELLSPPSADSADGQWSALVEAGVTVVHSDTLPTKHAVPIHSLEAAAGTFSGGRVVERLAWAVVPRPGSGQLFVARVSGQSMAPDIPDGAWCLFRVGVAGPLEGRIVLIQHRDVRDPDTESSYAVKRYGGVENDDDGVSVRLESINRQHRPYRVRVTSVDDLRPIAEFIRVIAPKPSPPPRRTRASTAVVGRRARGRKRPEG